MCIAHVCTYTTAPMKSRGKVRAGHAARIGEERNVYRILVGKPEGKGPLRRPKHRGRTIS
jgi:hypothetical protein